jgi:hypothetical protein
MISKETKFTEDILQRQPAILLFSTHTLLQDTSCRMRGTPRPITTYASIAIFSLNMRNGPGTIVTPKVNPMNPGLLILELFGLNAIFILTGRRYINS